MNSSSQPTTDPRRALAAAVALVLSALLLIPAAASAAERWAEPGGDGPAATCPQDDPCDLDTAVEHGSVTDGDEVIVKPGVYDVDSINVADAIELHGQPLAGRPRINTSGIYGVAISDAATIRKLAVTTAGGSTAVAVFGGGPTIEQVAATTTSPGGVACTIMNSALVRDTQCWGNATNTRGMGANAGVNAGERLIRLRNVTAVGTQAGIDFGFSGSGVAVTVEGRNVIADGDRFDVVASAQHSATVAIALEHSNYATAVETNENGSVTDPGSGTNQTAPPQFVNAADGDFRQADGSPTIDAGAIDEFIGGSDVDGDSRVLDGDGECPPLPDIGADEHPGDGPIDCEAPETTILSGPTGATTDSTPTFDFGASEPATFECSLDGAGFTPCADPFTTPTLANGPHALRVRAVDSRGNVDPTPEERSFTVRVAPDDGSDVTPPETTITSKPKRSLKSKRKRARVGFRFSADEAGRFECSLDGAGYAPCASPWRAKVGPGRHVFSVRAVDRAGNVDRTPATARFKVRRIRPGR